MAPNQSLPAMITTPLMKLGSHEIERLRRAIAEALLGPEGALDLAAQRARS